jgi:predicted TIM-barrel fold metal-dependent hydrolase
MGVHVLVLAPSSEPSLALTAELRHRAETHGARFTLLVPAGSGPVAEAEASRVTEQLRATGLPVRVAVGCNDPIAALHEAWNPRIYDEILISSAPQGSSRWLHAGLPRRVERLTGALVRHVPTRERVSDWRLAA